MLIKLYLSCCKKIKSYLDATVKGYFKLYIFYNILFRISKNIALLFFIRIND